MKNLVIVESPTKAKTIQRFLDADFDVRSSFGHVRDLPKGELGIDVENSFEPRYVIPKKAQKTINGFKKLLPEIEKIILATDEDREGEAIAWHLISALGLDKTKNQKSSPRAGKIKIERIAFHEITKRAIEDALKTPRDIDINLIEAQQARRILDRLVGYKLSPFLWKKLMRGLSAGRVQSVALRLITEREQEIKDFKSQDYWTISALIQKKAAPKDVFEALLTKINDKTIDKPGITDKNEAEKIIKNLEKSSWQIDSVEKKAREQNPLPPFITSTLQQAAWQRLKFNAKKTMFIAQQLYEGVELKEEGGSVGLITYMRTDSLNVSEDALTKAAEYLKDNLGAKYSLSQPRRFKTKSKTAQEAHEAIRPANPKRTPESIKNELSTDQHKLYKLIWERFIAGQMPKAIFEETIILINAACPDSRYIFHAKGSVLKFDGFLKIYPIKTENNLLPEISKNDEIYAKEIKKNPHQTQPPARYTDASLVKALEKFGIGRPSTYAQIISTIEERNYVTKDEAKRFVPTEIGGKVNGILVEHFPQIVDINFTAQMEENLDEIAEGKTNRIAVIKDFYEPFEKNLETKYESVEKQDLTEKTDEICNLCGKPMIIRYGRFGRFIACSNFPECKNTKNLPPVSLNIKCPLCKTGDVIERKTKRGKLFYGCSNWPKCQFAAWQKPTGELCPECQSPLVELKNYIKCSNKTCEHKEKKPA